MSNNDELVWSEPDILVSYDPETTEIRWTNISTGEVLAIHKCNEPAEEPQP